MLVVSIVDLFSIFVMFSFKFFFFRKMDGDHFDIVMNYDVFIGREGHLSEVGVMESLVNDPDFAFMEDDEPTVKIISYFFTNARGESVSLDELESRPIYLHGVLSSWEKREGVLGIGNVRVNEW